MSTRSCFSLSKGLRNIALSITRALGSRRPRALLLVFEHSVVFVRAPPHPQTQTSIDVVSVIVLGRNRAPDSRGCTCSHPLTLSLIAGLQTSRKCAPCPACRVECLCSFDMTSTAFRHPTQWPRCGGNPAVPGLDPSGLPRNPDHNRLLLHGCHLPPSSPLLPPPLLPLPLPLLGCEPLTGR